MINLAKKGIFSVMLLMTWVVLPFTLAGLTNYIVAALSLILVVITSIYLLRIRDQQKMRFPDYFHSEERLRYMAYHDPLTGLANRNRLEQFISRILDRSRRYSESFALLFIDLDYFKNINDKIGHEAGDLLLKIIADRLKKAVRNTDIVARHGGDEFVIVVTDVNKSEGVAVIAEKILQGVMEAVIVKGKEIYITASIGISLYPLDGQNMQTLMQNADLALYRAKDNGRNNYQFYTKEMTKKAEERMML